MNIGMKGIINIYYRSKKHKEIFERFIAEYEHMDGKTAAEIYLLSADHDLWIRMKDSSKSGSLDFLNVNLANLSTKSYALYRPAKAICMEAKGVQLFELTNSHVIATWIFELIIQALRIARRDDNGSVYYA